MPRPATACQEQGQPSATESYFTTFSAYVRCPADCQNSAVQGWGFLQVYPASFAHRRTTARL